MKVLAILAAAAAFTAAAIAAFAWSGLYDISATDQHLRATYHTLRVAMQRSVDRRARDIEVPPLGDAAQLERGVALFRTHCVQCHGGPGVAPEPFALALRPLPTPLARSGREQSPGYLFWVVKNGIKMTGMPAWEFRLPEDDLWALVAFLRALPRLSPQEYRALRSPPLAPPAPGPLGAPDPARGKRALDQYACVSCHEVPGMVGPEARLGPTLHGIGARGTIGGVLPNTPANMVRWIRDPQAVSPPTAMPNLGVTERDARDIAAHLATLK